MSYSPYSHLSDERVGELIKNKYRGRFDDVADAELGLQAKSQFGYKSAKMSPPLPPTAAQPTSPEARDTLKIQLAQLKSGKRRCVMFPRRTPVPFSARQFNAQRIDTSAGTFFFNPRLISAQQIRTAITSNNLPAILGDKDLGYGAPDKSQLTPPIRAVTALAPSGVPVQDVATDQAHEPQAIAAAQAVTPPGGSVEEKSADSALADRIKSGGGDGSGTIPSIEIPPAGTAPTGKRMKFRKAKRLGLAK
jgi:hypothetical protein